VRLPARLYAPGTAAALPVLLYLHGGGFTIGSIATHDMLCRELARLGGCMVLSLDYRLAPEHAFPPPATTPGTRWPGWPPTPPGWAQTAWPWAATARAARWRP
jgi:hypothetical protein